REQPAVRRDAGRGLPRLYRRPARARRRESRPVARRGRHRDGDRRGVLPADRRAVKGLPPARRAGAGDPPPARPVGPRRADGGPRPDPAGGARPARPGHGVAPTGGDGRVALPLTADRTADLRPEIFALAKARGWTLYELHQETGSLEELFRQLTAGGEAET